MSATLAKAINTQAVNVRVSGAPGHSIPFYARLEAEIVSVVSFYEAGGTARLVRGQFGTTRAAHAVSTEFVALDWADGIVELGTRVALFGEGAPVDGTDGIGALVASAGSTYTDITAGTVYVNNGTPTSPAWQSGGGGAGVTVTGSVSGSVVDATEIALQGSVSEEAPGIATQSGTFQYFLLHLEFDNAELWNGIHVVDPAEGSIIQSVVVLLREVWAAPDPLDLIVEAVADDASITLATVLDVANKTAYTTTSGRGEPPEEQDTFTPVVVGPNARVIVRGTLFVTPTSGAADIYAIVATPPS